MNKRMNALLKFGSAVALLAAAGSGVWSAVNDAPKPAVVVADGVQIGEPYRVLLKREASSPRTARR